MELVELGNEMLAFVNRRLEAILKTPDGWGPPHAVELQILLLLEMWHVIMGSSIEHRYNVTRRYTAFISKKYPGAPTTLSARMGLEDRASEGFVAILREFIEQERAWTS